MKLTDNRSWIAWFMLLLLAIVGCITECWSEDIVLLCGAYGLLLLSTWLCYRVRPRVAYGNLIVMIVYNAILAYNLVFNNRYGAGITWWFFALLLNTLLLNTFQSLSLRKGNTVGLLDFNMMIKRIHNRQQLL